MIKKAVQIGNPIVRAKSKDVPFNKIAGSKIQKLIKDLIDSMHHYHLVGMAAPQIGVNLNVFVSEIRDTKNRINTGNKDSLRVFINPKLTNFSQTKTVLMEGCGSLVTGQLFGPVKRPNKVTVKAFDEHGKKFKLEAKNLLAKVAQHEYDHLQGIICIDKFTDTKKAMQRDEYKKRK